ncbi:MAG: FtsW/RodA/SpoVE family cell cycle protein [Puniceicoccales bacterium]|jgi:rod shape determining protein RodA|nr:FtsW/RodA/SpoVE family cell cycle protein [Puniceicoccales bacterium]
MKEQDGLPPRRHLSLGAIRRWDLLAPLCMLFLTLMGIFAIHSAQSAFHGTQWRGQVVWFLGGIALYVLCAAMDYRIFLRQAHWLYGAGILLLLALWTPLGVSHCGAQRWIRLFCLQLQPAELAKLTTIFLLSATLSRTRIDGAIESKFLLLRLFVIFSIPWLLIFLQPDLGSALILPPILLALLYVSGLPGRFFLLLAAFAFAVLALLAWDIFRYRNFLDESSLCPDRHGGLYQSHSLFPLKDYQRNRILGFVAPAAVDPQGTNISWNLRQSLIAVGSGGFSGRGSGDDQTRLGYLPRSVATNDFLFSTLAEGKGFLGAFSAVTMLMVLSWNNLRIARLSRDRFGRYLAVSAAILLAMHTLINVGMTLGLMPITGVPLPFLSYGGSFLIVCFLLQGIVQSVYHRRQNLD